MHATCDFAVACNFSCFAWSKREAGSNHRLGFDRDDGDEENMPLSSSWRRNGFMTRQNGRLNRDRALDRSYTTWHRRYASRCMNSSRHGCLMRSIRERRQKGLRAAVLELDVQLDMRVPTQFR
jgi:hypothetical protein